MASVMITTGIVRIVQGHPAKAKQKTDNNNQPVFKDGKPVMQWFFAIAVPKAEWQPISQAMAQAAADVPGNNNPKFAWKFKDGDSALDANGKPYREKPGMAGCMILSVSTEFQPPNIFRRNAQGGFDVMNPDELKCGHFVRVGLKIDGHAAATVSQTPGLYINPQGVEWIAFGEEIFNGPDAMQMFGNAPTNVPLPPGASAMPVVSASAPLPPGVGTGPAAPAMTPAPMMAPTPTPQALAPAPAAPLPPGYPTPSAPAPAPVPTSAPAVAPAPVAPAPTPAPAPAPTVSPISPAPAPAYDIARGQAPVAYNGQRPIYQYSAPDANGTQWPIYGWQPDGNPIYQ